MTYYAASYKNVPFEVTDASVNVGRRVVLFEYPFSNSNYIEDLGKKNRAFSITAFVIGDDYQSRAERLIEVLEEGGKGKLIHPWLGSIDVYPTEQTSVSWNLQDRIATLNLSFIKAEEPQAPISNLATDYISRLCADSFISTAVNAFKRGFTLYSEINDRLIDIDKAFTRMVDDFTSYLNFFSDTNFIKQLGLINVIEDIKTRATEIFSSSDKDAISSAITETFNFANKASEDLPWPIIAVDAANATTNTILQSIESSSLLATDELMTANANAVKTLLRETVMANALGASTLINASLYNKKFVSDDAFIPVAVRVDVLSVRAAIISALNQELKYVSQVDEIFEIEKAITAVWNDLSYRAEDVKNLSDFNIAGSMPAILIAYEKYGDASRENEIVIRNNINNPNFISGSIKLRNE